METTFGFCLDIILTQFSYYSACRSWHDRFHCYKIPDNAREGSEAWPNGPDAN